MGSAMMTLSVDFVERYLVGVGHELCTLLTHDGTNACMDYCGTVSSDDSLRADIEA